MLVLAIDTALAAAQAAVWESDDGVPGAGRALAEASEPMARGHQERLAPLVAEVLEASGVAPADLGRVAVTVGPGSFTGLRVGLAFAKAFALARGLPCSGVGVLHALAASARLEGAVAACIAAPQARVYLQRFEGEAPAGPPRLLGIAEAATAAADARPVGPGASLLGGQDGPPWPDILAVARLGAHELAPPEPIYLREVGALTLAERRGAAGARP